METRTTTKITVRFSDDDMKIIRRLIIEQVGHVTIRGIMDMYSCVFDWYKALLSMVSKIGSGTLCSFDRDELNVLVQLLSKAYNSEDEPDKEAIKEMCGVIDLMRNSSF